MSSYSAGDTQTSDDVARLVRRTQLCKPCSLLFQGQYHEKFRIHHDSYASLCQSLEAGCQLCATLNEKWDFKAAKRVPGPEWRSEACRLSDALLVFEYTGQFLNSSKYHMKIAFESVSLTHSRLSCELFLALTSFLDIQFQVHPYEHEDPNDPPGALISRPSPHEVPGPISSKEHMQHIFQWFESCTGSAHSQCGLYRIQHDRQLSLPSRLLYFSSNQTEKVRLVEVQMEQIYQYVTLSHRWGTPEPLKLSHNSDDCPKFSHNAMTQGISISDLPRIFREALQIIHHCKLEYLWIDSLCIIQDDDSDGRKRDWEKEAVKTGDIYTGGVFNIAAVNSENSDGTLFPGQKDFSAPILQDSFGPNGQFEKGSRLAEILLDSDEEFDKHVLSSELLNRGWVYQEVILTPAKLFCTAQQMWWLCHTGRYCQKHPTVTHTCVSVVRSATQTTLSKGRQAIANPGGLSGSLKLWGELLRLYTKTSVTFKDDRLAAIAGLSKVFQSAFPGCVERNSYNSGFWSTNIIFQLSWHTVSSSVAPNRYTADLYIPSWSPVSCKTEIDYFQNTGQSFQLPIEWTMNTSGLHSFGRAQSIEQCILHLRGVLVEVTLGRHDCVLERHYVRPSSHPHNPDSEFWVQWDNEVETEFAAEASLKKRLRALILTVDEDDRDSGRWDLEGILLRPFRDSDLTAPDK